MDKIIEAHGLGHLLHHLGEMCNKLDNAAKTCYSVMSTEKSTLNELQDARNGLVDAIADVNVAAETVRRKMGISCDEIAEAEDAKIERWRRVVENGI